MSASKSYLTPNEAAALLMVAPGTLRVWAEKGLIKAHTTAGGHRRFLREEVERFRLAQVGGGHADPRRLLIVDDDVALCRYLSALIAAVPQPPATAVARDGFEAGRLLYGFRPQTVLLDLMMPGIDGYQICRQIKQDEATRGVRVIAMTGYPTPENVARILAAGAEVCLSKPIDEQRLLGLLGLLGLATRGDAVPTP